MQPQPALPQLHEPHEYSFGALCAQTGRCTSCNWVTTQHNTYKKPSPREIVVVEQRVLRGDVGLRRQCLTRELRASAFSLHVVCCVSVYCPRQHALYLENFDDAIRVDRRRQVLRAKHQRTKGRGVRDDDHSFDETRIVNNGVVVVAVAISPARALLDVVDRQRRAVFMCQHGYKTVNSGGRGLF